MTEGVEEIRSIPGNLTTLDLRDLTVGVSYGVSVTAMVGDNAGDPVTVYIKPGETNQMIIKFFLPRRILQKVLHNEVCLFQSKVLAE